ncbi:unnamed protein product [Pleuronectes platessa]|uniref:Uncharacterized protein n=1 Tax=Pleuronectes platessa TaxID=8262 RepID=A0A9N7V0P4_PLEPL|nr:unnamed protein product [Pleuronectes platessa]
MLDRNAFICRGGRAPPHQLHLWMASKDESTESWHDAWDQRTASPLRARGGQGLRDLCFTEPQLGCFTQQHPLRRQPQHDPAHCEQI